MTLGARRGNAVLVVMSLTALLGFTAMAVDLGLVIVAQAQVQVASDAVAHAAASALDGTSDGVSAAAAAASAVAAHHTVLGDTLSLGVDDVTVGRWDDDLGLVEETDPRLVDAVEVRLDAVRVYTAFASVSFGITDVGVATSTLTRRPALAGPARSTSCYLPLAVPACHLDGLAEGENPGPLQVHMGTRTPFSPAEQALADTLHAWLALIKGWDGGSYYQLYRQMWAPYLWPGGVPPSTVAWARPEIAPDDAWVGLQVVERCDSAVIEIGDLLVANDTDVPNALDTLADVLNDVDATAPDPWLVGFAVPVRDRISANYWDESEVLDATWTNAIQGPVPLVEVDDCEEPTWDDGSFEIVGFTWAAIYDVKSATAPNNVWVQLDVVTEYGTWGEVDPDGTGNLLGRGTARLEDAP